MGVKNDKKILLFIIIIPSAILVSCELDTSKETRTIENESQQGKVTIPASPYAEFIELPDGRLHPVEPDYIPLRGNVEKNTTVYMHTPRSHPQFPAFLFVIVDPLVYGNDGRRYMRVRYNSGAIELKDRDAFEFDDRYVIKNP